MNQMETFQIEIKKSNYDKSHKNGMEHFSVMINGHNRGGGSPCDTEEEVRRCLKQDVESYGVTEKNLGSYEDKTGLFPKGELFGQSLKAWF